MSLSLKIEGVKELQGALKRFIPAIAERSVRALAFDVHKGILANVSGRILKVRTERLKGSWKPPTFTGSGLQTTGQIQSKAVPYAAIHEFGGTTHPKVTGKMRGFAWFKFRETQDPMWRAIALTRKPRLNVPVPARHYVSLAIEATRERMPRLVEQSIRFVAKKEGLA